MSKGVEYEERFFWDLYIIIDTICLDDQDMRQRTALLFDKVKNSAKIGQYFSDEYMLQTR